MENFSSRLRTLAALFGTASALGGCGGGSDSSPPPPPAAAAVSGTAAVGAALANANVSIVDGTGASVCTEASIVTSGTGVFSCTLQGGKTAPFIVTVIDPSGAHPPLVSIASSTPAAGATLTVNATPLTTAIVGQLSPDGNALSVVADRSLVNVNTLAAITTNVLTQLAPVLTAIGAPAGYDPFSTQIDAATTSQAGNTADRLIETVRISTVNGVTLLSTVDNSAGAVPIAGATTTSPPLLPAPSAAVVTLSESLRLLSVALEGCFAVDVATRVATKDDTVTAANGGPTVTALGAACADITHPNYRSNGFLAGQQLYGLLNDAAMTGARFSPAELMLFIDDTSAADNDRAVINIRYVDSNGVAGNNVFLAQKFPGSATTARATDWWLYGNQQLVDSSIEPFVRRNDQRAPSPGTAPFANASASRYESGFNLFVNKDGPGSTGLRAARVTGPGLPPAGVVLTRPDSAICTNQNWLNIRRKDGNTDPAAATVAGDIGNTFRLQRTRGLSGTDATTVRPNPNAGNADNTAFVNWAHPLDYGAAVGATDFIDFSALKANTTYRFEYFYNGETTPRHTYNKTLLAPVIPSTRGGNLQWVTLDAATLEYLDPANAKASARTSIDLGWAANPLAETIRSAGVYTFGGGVSVAQGRVGVARGATSAVANAPGNDGSCSAGASFPALTNDGTSSRGIQLRHRMLDGSYKDSFTRFN
jgi:hypothetical protein